MSKNKVGCIIVIQRSFWNSFCGVTINVGEKGIVIECCEPLKLFENEGPLLKIALHSGIIVSVTEKYVRFANYKIKKSQRNLEKAKLRARLKKELKNKVKDAERSF